MAAAARVVHYERRRPESTTLYEVVRDNIETLYAAIDDGALDVRVPKHAKKELEAYLDCGLLCRGFARLRCVACDESRLVAWSCKGRGFCPSCLGRRMCATAANLVEHVLPEQVALRQWVLTFPFAWRRRLACDGPVLAALNRIAVESVERFYAERTYLAARAQAPAAASAPTRLPNAPRRRRSRRARDDNYQRQPPQPERQLPEVSDNYPSGR